MPWRLLAWPDTTFPVAVILKRFFAPDFVFSLGISRPFHVAFAKMPPCGSLACRNCSGGAFGTAAPALPGGGFGRRGGLWENGREIATPASDPARSCSAGRTGQRRHLRRPSSLLALGPPGARALPRQAQEFAIEVRFGLEA